jgi:hypothetical protein
VETQAAAGLEKVGLEPRVPTCKSFNHQGHRPSKCQVAAGLVLGAVSTEKFDIDPGLKELRVRGVMGHSQASVVHTEREQKDMRPKTFHHLFIILHWPRQHCLRANKTVCRPRSHCPNTKSKSPKEVYQNTFPWMELSK